MKQVPLIIWFTYYFISITYGQSNGRCACENPFIQILEYTDAKNQLVVCGTKSDSDSLIFELTVFDCLRDSFLLDFRFDEIFPHSVKQIHDGFVITDYHFAPIGDDWKLSLLPFSEITYTFTTNGELTKTERLIFNYPKLSFKQQNDIKLLCHKLKSYQGKPKLLYPLDYETIYMLFVGAYKNINPARKLFFDLHNLFKFDGAAAETLGEIRLEELIQSR